jgi:hypothetical protein
LNNPEHTHSSKEMLSPNFQPKLYTSYKTLDSKIFGEVEKYSDTAGSKGITEILLQKNV